MGKESVYRVCFVIERERPQNGKGRLIQVYDSPFPVLRLREQYQTVCHVHIKPAQTEYFTPSHTCADGQGRNWPEPSWTLGEQGT
jgi:hypothetical protein